MDAFAPARDGSDAVEIQLTVDEDGVRTCPLPLQQTVVEEMVARTLAPYVSSAIAGALMTIVCFASAPSLQE